MDWEEREGAETCKLFYLDIFLVAEECCLVPDGCISQGSGKELCPVPGCGLLPELPVLPLSSQMQRLGAITEGWWDRESVRQGSIAARAVALALQPMHDSVGEQPRLPRCGSPAMSPGAQDSSVWGTVQRAMEVRWDSGDPQLLWPWMGT